MASVDDEAWTAFVSSVGQSIDEAQVRPHLGRQLAAGARAWPKLELSSVVFARHIGAAVRDVTDLTQALAGLHADDAFLAAACLAGHAAAHAAFEATYGPQIRAGLQRLETPAAGVADLQQEIRRRVLVGDERRRPKLADYSGTGPLKHWLRVVIVRARADIARSQRRAEQREPVRADTPEQLAASLDDPEFAYLKSHYRELMREVFAHAVGTLDPRSRNVLRHSTIDGLSTEQIAAVYGVHAATARRWLARAREELWKRTRGGVIARLGIRAGEFDSIVRLVKSEMDLSVHRLLKDPGDAV